MFWKFQNCLLSSIDGFLKPDKFSNGAYNHLFRDDFNAMFLIKIKRYNISLDWIKESTSLKSPWP